MVCNPEDDGTCESSAPRYGASDLRRVYELHYVLEGSAELQEVGEPTTSKRALMPGDSMLIPPGISRQILSVPPYSAAPSSFEAVTPDNLLALFGSPGFGMASLVLIMSEDLEGDVDEARRVAANAVEHWRKGECVSRLPSAVVQRLLSSHIPEVSPDCPDRPRPHPLSLVGSLFTVAPDWLGLARWIELANNGALRHAISQDIDQGRRSPAPVCEPVGDSDKQVLVRKLSELQVSTPTGTLSLCLLSRCHKSRAVA